METWCIKMKEIHELISGTWKEHIQGSPLFRVQRKLKNCLKEVRGWCLTKSKTRFGIDWKELKDSLDEIQPRDASTDLANLGKEIEQRKAFEEEASIRWWYWRQRAKFRLDGLGDKSTTFFYKSVKERQLKVDIRALEEDGQCIIDGKEIQSKFQNYFMDLFKDGVL
uniref:Uncharacterized protein n=1 Tax=Chenopodium quinoa TaxID=63459 RepID=A0A803MDR4_CHEQI